MSEDKHPTTECIFNLKYKADVVIGLHNLDFSFLYIYSNYLLANLLRNLNYKSILEQNKG